MYLLSGNKRTDREARVDNLQNLVDRAKFRIVLYLIASCFVGMASVGLALVAGAAWLILFLVAEVSITMLTLAEIDSLF